jgi:hypothetical protein
MLPCPHFASFSKLTVRPFACFQVDAYASRGLLYALSLRQLWQLFGLHASRGSAAASLSMSLEPLERAVTQVSSCLDMVCVKVRARTLQWQLTRPTATGLD